MVVPVSYLRMIALRDLFDTTCVYDIKLGGTKVLSIYFNKLFILLLFSTFGNAPRHHSVHP